MDRAVLPGDISVSLFDAGDGDFACPDPQLGWSTVRQVHGNHVVVVKAGEAGELGDGDALVCSEASPKLAVRGADCPLIGLGDACGVFAAVHAGWRGLLSDVIGEAAAAMRRLGARDIEAVVGPYIGAECYEFSPSDLFPLVDTFGSAVRATTSKGDVALDLGACVKASLERAEIAISSRLGGCTACSDRLYSWRRRRDAGRHALVVTRGEQ